MLSIIVAQAGYSAVADAGFLMIKIIAYRGTTGGSTSGGATCGTRHSTRSPLQPHPASAAASPCVLDCSTQHTHHSY